MSDHIKIGTRILGYAGLPFETQEEIDYWFNPQTMIKMRSGQPRRVVVGTARMSEREKERYLQAEGHNLIVNQGRSQIISYIGTNGTYSSQFGNILSLGNGSIATVGGGDTTIPGEYYRSSITTQIYTGSTQVDMQTTITGSNGNGQISNIGIWGNGATTGLASGTMLTHALFTLSKATGIAIIDYLVVLS
jgi:hypothetical protein